MKNCVIIPSVKKEFVMLKYYKTLLFALGVCGCMAFPTHGDINEAHVFHWENDYVVMAKFIEDHKSCLGVRGVQTKTQMSNIFNNMKPSTVPQWDGLWATFESRNYREVGQRIAFSVPSDGANDNVNNYQKCMLDLGYRLTYKR